MGNDPVENYLFNHIDASREDKSVCAHREAQLKQCVSEPIDHIYHLSQM